MNIVIITIGNELLTGKTVNTNAAWIGKKLTEIGCYIESQIVIPDEESSIFSSLDQILKENPDCIIVTGGLGPTNDDITRQTLFEFVKTSTKFDSKYWDQLSLRFKKFGMDIPESNRNQALVPIDGEVIDNPIGTARGLKFTINKSVLYSLPGVPSEMKTMMEISVLPWVKENHRTNLFSKTIRTTGIPESGLIEDLKKPLASNHECLIGYYPSVYGVDIQLLSENEKKIQILFNNISDVLKDKIYSEGEKSIEEIVIHSAKNGNKTISVAESCTGGLVGDRITNVPGSSNIYKGGVVAYNNDIKHTLLNIDKTYLSKYGAVSEEVAKQMAVNVKKIFGSDIGLSITGIAGPGGGSKEKPVGLVFIGLANHNSIKVYKKNFGLDRINNKKRTSQVALNLLRLELNKNE
tara:strand:- start:1272 stop:2495 length:1224 start_codon:yes stop_codon:yes gene_type:complete